MAYSSQEPNANICLVFDDAIAQKFLDIAQKYFNPVAQIYCLGRQNNHGQMALPHISINHLCLENASQRIDIAAALSSLNPVDIDITLKSFQFRASRDHSLTAEFCVGQSDVLSEILGQVTDITEKAGLTALNPVGEDFASHVTICKMPRDVALPSCFIPPELFDSPIPARLCFGQSDGVGQLISYDLNQLSLS